jgi:hypothetical protein
MPINYKEYPANWRTEIRPRILERDGHRCTVCGVENYVVGERQKDGTLIPLLKGETYSEALKYQQQLKKLTDKKPTLITLQVAHLDQDEWNHKVKDERLATMCQKHHFAYDREDNNRRKKYGKKYKKDLVPIFSPEQIMI